MSLSPQWNYLPEPQAVAVAHLEEVLGVPKLIATLLVQRGITNFQQAKAFFRPQWSDLHNPFLMADMHAAVARIVRAVDQQELIMVYGDYDVDGTTSVALMSDYLKHWGVPISTYIPDRYTEGYGVSKKGIETARELGVRLIIALDCGIKSIDLVALAASYGIDFIICDHHNPGKEWPKAIAVLDPKRPDCGYPYKELCGCGVGFKLIQALHQTRQLNDGALIAYLDLVATAIAADIVPLTGENRVLAQLGLEQINQNPRPGLWALLQKRPKRNYDIADLVFVVAPRINAAGRIKHARAAVALLTEFNAEQALAFAEEIEVHNLNRRELDQNITREALQIIEAEQEQNKPATVLFAPHWHKGVIGIVASRLTEYYYRPTVIFTKSGEVLAASARSVGDFDLYEALEACAEHLIQFGGHKFAAGMTCTEAQFPAFKAAFEQAVSEQIQERDKKPSILIDACINPQELSPKVLRLLKGFEPFGNGNPSPVFEVRGVFDSGYAKTMGPSAAHLRCFLKSDDMPTGVAAVGFGLGHHLQLLNQRQKVDVLFTPEENEFNGQVHEQWRLRDLRRHNATASLPEG